MRITVLFFILVPCYCPWDLKKKKKKGTVSKDNKREAENNYTLK